MAAGLWWDLVCGCRVTCESSRLCQQTPSTSVHIITQGKPGPLKPPADCAYRDVPSDMQLPQWGHRGRPTCTARPCRTAQQLPRLTAAVCRVLGSGGQAVKGGFATLKVRRWEARGGG